MSRTLVEVRTIKRRGNPNWGKPEYGPVVPVVTEFEKTVDEYKLTPDQYLQSSQLREPLLKAWGFEIEAQDY